MVVTHRLLIKIDNIIIFFLLTLTRSIFRVTLQYNLAAGRREIKKWIEFPTASISNSIHYIYFSIVMVVEAHSEF